MSHGNHSRPGVDVGSTISHAELARLLLPVASDSPIFATPNFRSWLGSKDQRVWPPRPGGSDEGLWLVDTRDKVARRRTEESWQSAETLEACGAALILCSTRGRAGLLGRMFAKLPWSGPGRLPPARVESALAERPDSMTLTTLGFDESRGVPVEFRVSPSSEETGRALLLSRRSPFTGGLWKRVSSTLGDREYRVRSFQVRARGAGFAHVSTGEREIVIRVAPSGDQQELVRNNHVALTRLHRAADARRTRIADVLPEPLFAESDGSVLLLGESRLSGTLAWKVVSGPLAPAVRDNALGFLAKLKETTLRPEPLGKTELRGLIEADLRRVENASFADDAVRAVLRRQLDTALESLAEAEIRPYSSHGDYGYGNLLVDPDTGQLQGVIDWGTCRAVDVPGVDRVNLEIQNRRSVGDESLAEAVRVVWKRRAAHDALAGPGGEERVRALYRVGVCRFAVRALAFPSLFRRQAPSFERALEELSRLFGPCP